MGTTAKIIAISYLAAVVIGLALVLLLVWTTRARARRKHIDAGKLAHRERAWLGIMIVLLVALLFATIFFIPYGKSAGPNAQIVHVQASQFVWKIDPPKVTAGVPVQFVLTSTDVNHGFGIYDENETLLFQVQVIPGKTQKAVFTFDKPGTYRILCLEFCGIAHHVMISQIVVVA